jgi:phosphatidate cytidylyltransferase
MKRILTAIVALPILLYSVWSPIPYFFVVLAAIAAVLALNEFYALAAKAGCRPFEIIGHLGVILLIACFVWQRPQWVIAVLSALVIASLGARLARPQEMAASLISASSTIFGVVYVGLLCAMLVGVRMIGDSMVSPHIASKLLTLFFAIVMLTDTGAYYTGRAIGRHKLAPRVSPGKTIEGTTGGFVAALGAGPLCRLIFFPELPLVESMILGALVSILGQAGDLVESMLKRGSGVKDSSNLLPGHGGMLDRLDSILFAAPAIYYYSRYFTSNH